MAKIIYPKNLPPGMVMCLSHNKVHKPTEECREYVKLDWNRFGPAQERALRQFRDAYYAA